MRKRALRVAAAAAFSLALVAGPTVAANANVGSSYSNANIVRATAGWTSNTDTLTVTDRANDGWGARVRADFAQGIDFFIDNTSGANTTRSQGVLTIAGDAVRIQACAINNSIVIGCAAFSGWTTA